MLQTAIKIILAILFLLCLLEMPYGYYQIVRFAGLVGFGILALSSKRNKTKRNDNNFYWTCFTISTIF
jgi:hypothetical protein